MGCGSVSIAIVLQRRLVLAAVPRCRGAEGGANRKRGGQRTLPRRKPREIQSRAYRVLRWNRAWGGWSDGLEALAAALAAP